MLLICAIVANSMLAVGNAEPEFFAYHTHIQSNEEFERYSRTGEYSDVIVNIGSAGGKLVFWRGTSYLPVWETKAGKFPLDEVIFRKGDGDKTRPDRVNAFSHIAVVESTPNQVTVCWRYLPEFDGGNPYRNVSSTNFAEEYYQVRSDGKVVRTVKRGTATIDAWADPQNQTIQLLQLSSNGVAQLSRQEPRRSAPAQPIAGVTVRSRGGAAPVREWRFDEGVGDQATESMTGSKAVIPGHKTLWRRGISGSCLQFDDYNTAVSLPLSSAPALTNSLTLESWVAIGAYPWNWCPIIQQGDDDGYFLGIDAHGHPAFKVNLGGQWQELSGTARIDRFAWAHIAGVYDRAAGMMILYLNGKAIGSKLVGSDGLKIAAAPIQIGKGRSRIPADSVGRTTTEATYAFDGLIDEVRIFDQALTPEQVTDGYALLAPRGTNTVPDMDKRALPKYDTGGSFGAHYTRLKYFDTWDNMWRVGPYPDVVVGFDQVPTKFVFWRGTGDIPMLVNPEDQWYSNEFNETWNRSGGKGCQEPMSDKQSLFNHVRVIENTPARVIVHWRFPLMDVNRIVANYHADTGWGDWSDWYYYIYPDGMAVKNMHLWTDGPRNHEFQESMVILGPEQHPEQVLETDPALIMADLDGNPTPYSWIKGPPKAIDLKSHRIHIVNNRSEYDAVTIGDFNAINVYNGELTPYSVFPTWNHWPVSQVPSDGRYASFPDRAAHSSLTHLFMPDFNSALGDRPFQEKLLMEGMTRSNPNELAQLARSWLLAPSIETIADCRDAAYDPSQRAYVLSATGAAPEFRIAASQAHPMANACVVVKNWPSGNIAEVHASGLAERNPISPRQGIERDPDGKPILVVWLPCQSTNQLTIKLSAVARP